MLAELPLAELSLTELPMTSTQKSILVADAEAGERLDRVLAAHIAELSRTRLKALIEAGSVTVDGGTIRDPAHRVNSGAAIAIDIPPPAPAKPAPEAIPLTVVYEDADIIVIDKPKGLVVHPAAGNWSGTLVNALIAHCGESLSGIGGARRPGIVHRLDKDTTGLMVVAKNDRAHRALAAQFAGHGRDGAPFERGYLAFVWGAPDRPRGSINRPLGRHPQARDRMAIREGGREAITHWELRERYDAAFMEYAKRVPLFLPRPPRRHGAPQPSVESGFSWEQYKRNREYQAALGAIVALGVLWLRMYLPR